MLILEYKKITEQIQSDFFSVNIRHTYTQKLLSEIMVKIFSIFNAVLNYQGTKEILRLKM